MSNYRLALTVLAILCTPFVVWDVYFSDEYVTLFGVELWKVYFGVLLLESTLQDIIKVLDEYLSRLQR